MIKIEETENKKWRLNRQTGSYQAEGLFITELAR